MEEQKDVFISYSTKDQAAKDELVGLFKKEGITYFLDENDLKVGENIDENLEEALRNTRFTVLLVSEKSLLSPWVSKEFLFRMMQEKFHNTNTLLPILLDDKVFEEGFEFDIYDAIKAKQHKQKELRKKAEERNIDTAKYNVLIQRFEEILPKVSKIIQKLTEGLSVKFYEEEQKVKGLDKIIETINARKNAETQEQVPEKKSIDATNLTYADLKEMLDSGESLPIVFNSLDNFEKDMGSSRSTYNQLKREFDTGKTHPSDIRERLGVLAKKFLA